MIPAKTTAGVGTKYRLGSNAGEIEVTVISAFQLPQLQVELPPLSQFRVTTHNAGIVQWSAGGSGNAMALTGPSAGLTFFSLSENSAGAVQFRMDQELGG
jgi:hypothetical protein